MAHTGDVRALCAAALLAALAVPAAAYANPAPPRLGVVSSTETRLVVQGRNFGPRERLLVRLIGTGVSSRRVVAGPAGAFRVSLVKPEPQACGRYFLTVRRASGRSVSMKLGPNECADSGVGS